MSIGEFKIKVIPMSDKLLRFAKRFFVNTHEAEDAVQEVFIKLWNLKDELDNYNSIEAFAFRITRNLCIDKIRTQKPTITIENNSSAEIISNNLQTHNNVELEDTIDKVHKIINTLPEQQRAIIQLRDIEGYSYKEIAEIMDLNLNTLKVNLSRARKKVKETLMNLM